MIGSRAWMDNSHGELNFKEKIKLIKQIFIPTTLAYSKTLLRTPNQKTYSFTLQDFRIPDTAIVKEAIIELEQSQDLTIFHHSWRSYFWGMGIAQFKNWQFDEESFLIACLMHDLGLVEHLAAYSCHCFTYESALRSESLCLKHRYPRTKTQNISNAICLHMNGYLNEKDPTLTKEVLLLQQATSCDVIGTNYRSLPTTFSHEVLTKHPRKQFNTHFNQLLKNQSLKHPQSRTALLSKLGLPAMIKMNTFKE
jgi:cyanamide hydratase family protein with HD domain